MPHRHLQVLIDQRQQQRQARGVQEAHEQLRGGGGQLHAVPPRQRRLRGAVRLKVLRHQDALQVLERLQARTLHTLISWYARCMVDLLASGYQHDHLASVTHCTT